MEMTRVYLSLGGNEGLVLTRLKYALHLLSLQANVHSLQVSHFYQTAPIEVNSSSWFINAVCSVETSLKPTEVFNITQAIEIQLGKVNKPKNASRPIDIDLLFYGHLVQKEAELQIPHPRWKERLFVLIPLSDLIPEIIIHGSGGNEHYVLKDLIQPLLMESSQTVSLLEKNPGLQ